MQELTPHQTVFAVVTSLVAFGLVLELVPRRRLREEYSWLWLLTAGAMIVLALWFRLLLPITYLVGAVTPLNTLLLCAVLFLFAIAVHYSVIIYDTPRGVPEWRTDNPATAAEEFAARHPELVLEPPAPPFDERSAPVEVTHWGGGWPRRRGFSSS